MTKKIISLLLLALLFTSCALFRRTPDPTTHDEGVVINGIRWATRNVDMPGTFAATPESPGMFFQWNRKKAWNVTDRYFEDWDDSITEGYIWARENDPCPAGWRVPTRTEIETLQGEETEWINKNGVDGRLFGTAPNQIFLPAVGFRSSYLGRHRSNYNGELRQANSFAVYWSRTLHDDRVTCAWTIFFPNPEIPGLFLGWSASRRNSGLSIRCVSK